MVKILLTRPQKLSQKIAQNLAQKNLPSLTQPLFSVSQIDNLKPINQKLQAVLITSSSAVFALEKLLVKKNILVLAVGKKTALEVKKLGYKNVLIANNSAATLLDLALNKLSNNSGLVVYLSGENITLDLAGKLQEHGFDAKRIAVYKTVPSEKFATKTIDEIKNGTITEIWFYSQNSVRIFYKLAKKHNLLVCLGEIKILCLSQKVAELAKELGFLNIGIIKE
jgi:uroporphyrinogen-III synthase